MSQRRLKHLIQHYLEDSFSELAGECAIKQGTTTYSFADVDRLADAFAAYYQKLGLAPGTLVGILSRVRIEAIAAMIGALRAGVVYVPVNIHAPASWIGNVARKSGMTHLLADPAFFEKADALREHGITAITALGREVLPPEGTTSYEQVLAAAATPVRPVPRLADDLAYILYTSGSTGDPKGIMITHRNAYSFIAWMADEFAIGRTDRILSRAPLQFDLSVFDIFTTLSSGATLVIPELGFANGPHDVVTLMRSEAITVVYTVPSAFIGMLTKGELERGIPSLRLALYAGEPFPTPYLRRVMQCLPGVQVSNIYGPTETNIVTYHHLYEPPATDDPVPIGRPVADCEAYIVDEHLARVPDGEIGEILIRGGTVFAGYFNRPDLTAERLVQSPFHEHPTLCCRTGDYGRILPDGSIAYHGRMDSMVKTRGYRVEIGEVEAALSALAGVSEACVVAIPHEKYGNTLHAYLRLKGDATVEDVKAAVSERLPYYMVPFAFIPAAEFPRTATGKIDRVNLRHRILEDKYE